MVALWIRLGTMLAGDGPLGVRLLAPFATALGTVLLFRAAEDLLPNRRAGLTAAALLNATLLMGIGAVTMTPDTPLLLFWTATLWALGRMLATGRREWWLAAGAAAGLALDSKYTALLLLPCTAAWIGMVPPLHPWLRRPQPWAAAAIAAVLFAPVLIWNSQHEWVSFSKQAQRAADWNPTRGAQYVAELIGGQIGLATPLIALLCGAGIVLAARETRTRDPAWTLLAMFSLIPSLVFVQHAVGDRVQANWPSVLYPTAAIAAAGLSSNWLRLLRPAVALGFAITLLVWVQGVAAPLPLPMRWDPTLLRLGGWDALAAAVDAARLRERADFVVAENYGDAAILARALPAEVPVLAVDARWSFFDLPDARPLIAGHTGLLLRSARREDAPDASDWSQLTRLGTIARARDGITAEDFFLYRVVGRAGAIPVAIMPRPLPSPSPLEGEGRGGG